MEQIIQLEEKRIKVYDCHVHSDISHDGKSAIQDYLKVLGVSVSEEKPMDGVQNTSDNSGIVVGGIGFTEHVDFHPLCGGYQKYDYEKFIQELDQARSAGYQVFKGAELGYVEDAKDETLAHAKKAGYDFTICSLHRVGKHSLSTSRNLELFQDADFFKSILIYYYEKMEQLLNEDFYDVIGHIGIFRRYLNDAFFEQNPVTPWLEALEADMAEKCAKSHKIIEVNTSGYFSPSNNSFPHDRFLKYYYDAGGRLICLGSDAHSAKDLGKGFDRAIAVLQSIGFEKIVLPWDKKNSISIKNRG